MVSPTKICSSVPPIALLPAPVFSLGVLEHPAWSRLWLASRLPRPGELPDEHGGFSVSVTQVSWGHVALKPTWLYFVGVDRGAVERSVRTGGRPTHWIGGFRRLDGGRRKTSAIPPGIKSCSKEQRRRTPVAFAWWLVGHARTARSALDTAAAPAPGEAP